MNPIKHITNIASILLPKDKELHINQTTEELLNLPVASSKKAVKLVSNELIITMKDTGIKEDVPD